MRPWLGSDPVSHDEQVKLYHRSKFNASIPGCEYATALEVIALTSYRLKLNSMDVDLKKILERWINVDSHTNIEAHLPQLIPLSYIDHIYIPKNLYDSLSNDSRESISANFEHRITIVPHDGEANQPSIPRGPTPSSKSRAEYQQYVINKLMQQYNESMDDRSSRLVRGAAITIASTDFTDHHLLPLTISQAYEQYCFAKKHSPPEQIFYIYWQATHGDMMLILSNEPIVSGQKQPSLRCLTSYIAPKPILTHSSYHEHYSYVDNNTPFKHYILRETGKFAAKSNRFHIGCNTNDFMTFCLEIHRSIGLVKLTHAGSNSIYNHEIITYNFKQSELDLTTLNFVHVSSGSRTVAIRNLIICFEKENDLHPTFDKNFKKVSSISTADNSDEERTLSHQSDTDKQIPCKWGSSCREMRDRQHREKYFHPISHRDKDDAMRPQSGYRQYPCMYGTSCYDHNLSHRAKYSHPPNDEQDQQAKDRRIPCRYGVKCYEYNDQHRAQYSHPPNDKQDQQVKDRRTPCRYGINCYDHNDQHRAQYSHPKPTT